MVGALAALAALVCALAAIKGPATAQWASVHWPDRDAAPRATAPGAPQLWYTPLLVAAHSAQHLEVSLPCTLEAGLVLTTARSTVDVWRLLITAEQGRLIVDVGTNHLADVPWPPGNCTGVLSFADGDWTLRRQGTDLAAGYVFPPAVGGLFSAHDPLSSGVAVELRTKDFSSKPSSRQWVFHIGTLLFGLIAIAAVARRERRPRAVELPGLHVVDGIVAGSLILWWAAGPLYYDDGWLMATVFARRQTGASSNYFDTYGASLPLGFLQHMLLLPFAYLKAPVLAWKALPLVLSLGTWSLLRVAFTRLLGRKPALVGLVALAGAFLVFAFAWLLTLRPEPTVAALSAGGLLAVLVYHDTRSRAALTVAVVTTAVAATLHPSGLVAGAPLVFLIPALWRDVRSGLRSLIEVLTIATIGFTAGIAFLFADSDLRLWRDARAAFVGDGYHTAGFRQEPRRYHDLLTNGPLTAIASVLFAALAIALWLGQRRRKSTSLDMAGLSLATAGLLLCFTPSKWIYHFGSATAIAVLAIAVEAQRLTVHGRRNTWLRYGAAGLTAVVVARALRAFPDPQYFLALRPPDVRSWGKTAIWVALIAVALAVATALRRGDARATAAGWVVPIGVVSIAGITLATRAVAPIADSPPWSAANRGLRGLRYGGCEFAELIDVSDTRQANPLAIAPVSSDPGQGRAALDVHSLVVAPREVGPLAVYSTKLDSTPTSLSTPWYAVRPLDANHDMAMLVEGIVDHYGNRLYAEWARREASGATVLQRVPLRLDRDERGVGAWEPDPWRKLRLSRVSPPPANADLVRFVLDDNSTAIGHHVTVTAPFVLPHTPLSALMHDRTVLVAPPEQPLLTCARHARVDHGLAEMPEVSVGFVYLRAPFDDNSLGGPFAPWYLYKEGYSTTPLWAWLNDRDAALIPVLDPPERVGRLVPAAIVFAHGS